MKVVKGKYIRLTESELHALIREEVKKVIPLILEYAIPRNKFIDLVYNLTNQICENWCLIRFSRLISDSNQNVNHWKAELSAHMRNISSTKIKKNDSTSSRLKAILEGFNWSDFDNSTGMISRAVAKKFADEGYPIKNEEPFITVWFDFKNEIKVISELMANSNDDDITKYIESL